jgi:hypothetical protein
MIELDRPPGKSLEEWLEMGDFQQFLIDSVNGDIPIYYVDGKTGALVFLSSLLLPKHFFQEEQLDELINWQDNPVESKWGYDSDFYDGEERTAVYHPYDFMHSEILKRAVPILTRRTNTLYKNRPAYYEINSEISHIHDLHWSEEHQSYCTLDENADIWEVIKIKQEGKRTLITIAEPVLEKHMILGDYLMLRFFDLDRWEGEMEIPESKDHDGIVYWHDQGMHARWTPARRRDGTIGRAFLRGFQILRPPSDSAIRRRLLEGKTPQYCTFIAYDWKHRRVGECSCDPDQLGNYFVESPHPYETTPAFFKREVLRKYQSDAEKYTVEDRRIECRSSWSLPFDINSAEQVHAYLIDLSRLPHAEQLHWKSYNEHPKEGISRRAYKTDFLAEWDTDPEPLRDLKLLLESLPSATGPDGPIQVWRSPDGAVTHLADQIHYPTGNSRNEWETEILELDKLVVEGLNLKYLRQIAKDLGIQDERLQSILLLREVLSAKGIAPDLVATVIDPIYELHDLRSTFAGHRAGSDAERVAKELRRKHRSLANHFHNLVVQIYEGFSVLADLIQGGYLNLP